MAALTIATNLKKSAIAALWLAFLTLPVMVIRVDTVENTVTWRWMHLVYMLGGSFVLALIWHFMMDRRDRGAAVRESGDGEAEGRVSRFVNNPRVLKPLLAFGFLVAAAFPWVFSMASASTARPRPSASARKSSPSSVRARRASPRGPTG